jgi:hypothetical protein
VWVAVGTGVSLGAGVGLAVGVSVAGAGVLVTTLIIGVSVAGTGVLVTTLITGVGVDPQAATIRLSIEIPSRIGQMLFFNLLLLSRSLLPNLLRGGFINERGRGGVGGRRSCLPSPHFFANWFHYSILCIKVNHGYGAELYSIRLKKA